MRVGTVLVDRSGCFLVAELSPADCQERVRVQAPRVPGRPPRDPCGSQRQGLRGSRAGLGVGWGCSAARLSAPADPAEHGVRQAPAGRGRRVPKQVPELHGRGRQDPLRGGLDQDEGSASCCSQRARTHPGAQSPSRSLGSRGHPSGGSPCAPRKLRATARLCFPSASWRRRSGSESGHGPGASRRRRLPGGAGAAESEGRRRLPRRTRGRLCP